MQLALVDDSSSDRSTLLQIIKKTFDESKIEINEIEQYENGDTFFKNFFFGRFDLIFLDIFMQGISGIQIAQKIRTIDEHVRIVFCTSSNDFASEAFSVDACYYILKPVTCNKLQNLVQRMELLNSINDKSISLPNNKKIPVQSIAYTECMNHMIFFHLSNGRVIKVRFQQKKLEHILSPFSHFYSCSRGVVVNFNYVSTKKENCFIMNDTSSIPISRRRKKETIVAYEKYLFQSLKECE